MRVMLVHPGAPFSTSDVADGYAVGLRALGVDVLDAPLDSYIRFCSLGVSAAGGALDGANTIALAGAFVAQKALIDHPDLLLVIGGTNFHRGTADALTSAGIKTCLVLLDSPYLLEIEAQLASAYGFVTTNERMCVRALEEAAPKAWVRYLPTAYHPGRHRLDGPRLPDTYDVSFVGSMFDERRALFDALDCTGLRCAIGGFVPGGDGAAYHNDGVARLYRSTLINVNHHRTTMRHGDGKVLPSDSAESLGPRAYEIAACGAFQLIPDDRPEARDVFGDSLATYRAGDADDLGRQIRRWLADDAGRERMAAAQHQAVQGHSYVDRARSLLRWL